MPTTTLNTILPAFARTIGAYIGSFSTTTNLTTNNNVVSTGLTDAGFTANDSLNDAFIRIKGTNNDDVRRRIDDYTGATGTVVVSGTVLAADSGSQTFEIYRYDVNQLVDAINDGADEAYPMLHQIIYDNTLTRAVGQNLYARPTSISPLGVRQIFIEPRLAAKTFGDNIVNTLNCDFEESTVTTNWTTSQVTLTAEAETNSPNNFMVFAGTQSGKFVVTASQAATAYLAVPDPTNYSGEELNVSFWSYSKTASRLSAAISVDSASATTGSTHSGSGWELLTVSSSQTVGSTINVGMNITSGVAFTYYADEVIVTAGPSEIPRPSGDPVLNWSEEGDNIRIPGRTSSNLNYLVVGIGALSTLSSGTGTIEIADSYVRTLLYYAAEQWFQQDIDQISQDDLNAAQRRWRHFLNRAENGKGVMIPPAMRKTILQV